MKRLYMIILSVLGSIGIAIAISYAWFLNDTNVNPVAQGRSGAAYFAYGNGTTEPYGITTKRHLYNLAWLTYLFPEDYADKKYELAADIDCDGMALPPIGKDNAPFTGYFDGQGHTITDLVTSNNLNDMTTKPNSIENNQTEVDANNKLKNANYIGFFGSIDADGSSNAKVYDFYLNNTTVKTATSQTCVGVVAGYVNGKIEDVGVIAPHLNIQTGSAAANTAKTSNLSDYAVVGYAEEAYTTQKTKTSTIIYNPTYNYSHFNFKGMGNQTDWGGSMNMLDMFQRVRKAVTSSYSTTSGKGYNFDYVYREIVQENGNIISDSQNSSNAAYGSYYYPKKYDDYSNSLSPEDGKYYVSWRSNSNNVNTAISTDYSNGRFNYISALYKDLYTITTTDGVKTGYKIHDDKGNYLTINSSSQIINTDDEDKAVIWLCEGNKLYTYNQMIYSTTIKYFVTGTATLNTTLQTNQPSISWYWDATNKTFYYNYNTMNYYLKYYNGNWCVTPLYKIHDGNGNYLKAQNSTSNNLLVQNTQSESEATIWTFENNGTNPYGKITTIISNTTKYLGINNGNLVTGNTQTSWSNSGSGLYNGSNYIQFRNEYWVAMANPAYKIGYNTNYLSTAATNTTSDNAALWTFGNTLTTSGGNGTISMILQGATQYLRNNNGNLEISTTSTTWYNDGGDRLYSTYDNQKYYLMYDNGWKLDRADYYIKDSASNYLTFNDSTTIKNLTSATTLWHFSNGAASYPQGIISYIDGNSTYYLDHDGTSVILSNAANTTWINDGDGLYCTINGVKNYLVYDNGWKLVSYTNFKISYNGNYLIVDGSGNLSNSTNQSTATEWTFSNGGTNPSGTISANGYYLYLDADGVLTTTSTAGIATTFSNIGSGLYDSNNNYIQFYNNKWVCGKAFNIKYNTTYMSYNGSFGTTANWLWFYYSSDANPQGYIYTVYNGNVYYLYNNNGTLTCDQSDKTNWSHGDYGIYTNYENDLYVIYSSGWMIKELDFLGYKLSYNGVYLNISSNTAVTGGTSEEDATLWYVDSSNRIYTYYNGSNRYLRYNYGVSLNTGTNNAFTYSGDAIVYSSGYNTRYLYYNNSWTTRTSSVDIVWTETYEDAAMTLEATTYYEISTISSITNNRNSYILESFNNLSIVSISKYASIANSVTMNSTTLETHDLVSTRSSQASEYCYIPLNADASTFAVDSSNTGYIIGGGHETVSNGQKSDIRISQYPISDISKSYSSNTISNVRTRNTAGQSSILTETQISSFKKYNSAKQQLEEKLKGQSNVYGMHFMDSSISMNHLITAPKVVINGKPYTNYQMPEDCIDFRLASRGYINFFSGSYYPDNDSFFSLHIIIRDENESSPTYNKILGIKEISKIYAVKNSDGSINNGEDYVYAFSGESDNYLSNTAEYSLIFDTSVLTLKDTSGKLGYSSNGSYLYYFEIPVNKGEYALGSVSGGNGAYLIYLDIGANAAPVDRTEIKQQTNTTYDGLKYVNGIQILSSASFTSDADSSVAIITVANANAANGNDITISRNNNTITYSMTLNSTYTGEGITLSGGTTITPISSYTYISKVLKYVDYNRSTEKLYYTTVYADNSSDLTSTTTNNTRFDCFEINRSTLAVVKEITETGDAADWGLLKIDNGSGVESTITDSYFAFTTSTTTKILDYYSYILTSSINSLSQTIAMNVVNDTTSAKPSDDTDYDFERIYAISGNAITLGPDDLLVYIGPDSKSSATITDSTTNVVTVTVNGYIFTFNADAIDIINKTVRVYVSA